MKLYSLTPEKIKSIKPQDVTVSVYGVGKMGLPLAVVFAYKGFTVIGVDVNETTVHAVNIGKNPVLGEDGLDEMLNTVVQNKKLYATTDLIDASKKSDIKIIIVPTYIDDNNNPDLSIVKSVTKAIGKGLQKGDIVILESTAPPGTTMSVVGKLLEMESKLKIHKDFSVAHCPERTSSGTAIEDIMGRLCPKIVGGSDEKTTSIMQKIYGFINGKGVIPVKDTLTAELVKVWEGVYRDVNIAFANSMYLNCREMGIDAIEVINACNTDYYCRILKPSPGVGGHCIPVYPYFILNAVKENKDLLTLSRKINDSMSSHVIQLAKNALKEKGLLIKNANILVLGLAYRAGVKETRKSPGLKIARELMEISDHIFGYDPMFNEKETAQLGLSYKKDFKNIDCIIITTSEKEFKDSDWKKIAGQMKTKIIIQGGDIIDNKVLEKSGFYVQRIGYAH